MARAEIAKEKKLLDKAPPETAQSLRDNISKLEKERKEKQDKFFKTMQTEIIIEREEEIKKQNEDEKILNDENAFPQDRQLAEERIAERNEEFAGLQAIVQEREEAMLLREKINEIFKKYGVTVTTIFVAAGVTIAAVVGTITNA